MRVHKPKKKKNQFIVEFDGEITCKINSQN